MNRRNFFGLAATKSVVAITAPAAVLLTPNMTSTEQPQAGRVIMEGNKLSVVGEDGTPNYLGIRIEREVIDRPTLNPHAINLSPTHTIAFRTVAYRDEENA